MEKEGQQVNTYTDKYTYDEYYNDEEYKPEPETASKRQKRHTLEQIQELRAAYQQNDHPDEPTRRALGAKIGLEARQVQYWFQNQRSQMQAKALVQSSMAAQQENAALVAENMSLRHAILTKSCITCGGAMVPVELPVDNRRLLMENARLRDEYMRAAALVNQILLSAKPPAERPPVVARAGQGANRVDRAARLQRHADAAMDQFLLLATKGEPLWLPTPDGDALNYLVYQKKATLPVHHGFFPDGFVMEATRETGVVRAAVADLIFMLIDAKRWSEMFPGVVVDGTARSDAAISGGVFGSSIQLMSAELQVHSPRLLNRRINFLRYTKPVAERQWAVMDVSADGIFGPPGSRTAAATIANNTVVLARYTGCRLLPSGCLIEDMDNGYCKITWVVHAEYAETTVPTVFRPLLRSGKALGAQRWLASLQRQCEYLAVLHSSQIPRGSNTAAAISSLGKRGVLELAQRMMAAFYSAVSGRITQPSSKICEWRGSADTSARGTDASVRMVTWKKAGSVADLVLSATTTVWLPNMPPQLVFQYLCDRQRRGEWDAFANGAALMELYSVATGHLQGNAVSVLYSIVMTAGTDSKRVLILQEACIDASCSMVVYAPVEEDFMREVMNGGDHTSVCLMPFGFAVLPDGHGRARHAPSSSSSPAGRGNTAGSFLTVACHALLPGLSLSDNHASEAFDSVGNLLCCVLKKIQAAVRANIIIPA